MNQQRQELTERDEREAWAKIPRRPRLKAEAKVHFDAAHVYARDEGVDPDAVSHGATRDEAETWLKAQDLTESQRAVVLAEVFDKLDKTADAGAPLR